jgi:hypothetical protein
MALEKAKELKNGVSATYWRVSPAISVDMVARTAHGKLLLYLNEDSRRAGKDPLHPMEPDLGVETNVTLEGEDFETAIKTGELRDGMYAKVKTEDFFKDAKDLL